MNAVAMTDELACRERCVLVFSVKCGGLLPAGAKTTEVRVGKGVRHP